MDAALYDPEDGFYAEPPVGVEGHFLTSPHVSPAFGALVARQLGEAWDLLGQPDPFHVVEWAAGDGTLARQVLSAFEAHPPLARTVRYVGVERTPGAIRALRAARLEATSPDDGPSGVTGVVLANELLDNLPFRLARKQEEGVVELLVGLDGNEHLTFVAVPADDSLAGRAGAVDAGATVAISDEPERWLQRAAGDLQRGYVLIFDYGGEGPRTPQTYRGHQAGQDLLLHPGSADITAGVDLTALATFGERLGLRVWGPVSQRDALLALGFGERAEADRVATAEAVDEGRHLEAARRWAERSRESLLIDPGGLGSLQVMAFGIGVDAPLAAVRGDA